MTQTSKPRTHAALYLLTGLFAGIVLGFGAALLLQNYSFSGISPFFGKDSDSTGIAYSDSRTNTASDGRKPKGKGVTADASADEFPNNDIYSEEMAGDDTLLTIQDEGPDAVVRDELIGSKKVKLAATGGSATGREGASETDSLLTSLTGVKHGSNFTEYILEFWQNPLNYKGYKIVRDKIILFGLSPEQSYRLTYGEGLLVLQTPQHQYALRENSDFLPLIPRK